MNIYEIIGIVIVSYVVINIVAYRIQEYFIFHPEILPADFEYKYDRPFEELFFEPEPNAKINGLRFPAHDSYGLVLYFHGNTRSIKGWAKYANDFTRHGFDVVMIDYRGFGKSTGKRSHKNLKNDAQFVYEELKKQYPESRIVVYGRSIGSGFATKLASANFPRMLILDAPYYSFTRLTRRYLPFLPIPWVLRYPIPTYKWIKYVKCPVRIIHGTHDRLIPVQASIDLTNIMPQQTQLYQIENGKHNDLPASPEYHQALGAILEDAKYMPDDRSPQRTDLF